MSGKPIDPYWWCRHDEKLAKLFWERVERPLLMAKFKELDDPKFWEPPPKKKGVTLVEYLVVVAILLTLAGLLWPAISAARAAAKRGDEREPSRTVRLETVQHDGHYWVMSSAAYTVPAIFHHHPDCPCRSRKAEEER